MKKVGNFKNPSRPAGASGRYKGTVDGVAVSKYGTQGKVPMRAPKPVMTRPSGTKV